jgi:hypothetical protein
MAYKLPPDMQSLRLLTAAALLTLVAACAPSVGFRTTPGPPPPPSGGAFRADDFGWSRGQGRNGLAGKVAYRRGPLRYTCAGSTVILTPETPWTRQRMSILYKSAERAALPADEVRARTPSAPAGGDYSAFVRRATCDAADRFSFGGLPDGAWYVITVARPAGDPKGSAVALMRRAVTKGGKTANADL